MNHNTIFIYMIKSDYVTTIRLLVGALVTSTNFQTEQHEQVNGMLLQALCVEVTGRIQ